MSMSFNYEDWEKEDLVRRCYQLDQQLRQAVARASAKDWELSNLREDNWRHEEYERSKQGIFG